MQLPSSFVGLVAALVALSPAAALAGGSLPTVADNSGAFSYSIPIAVPSGPAGAHPDLALQYSSAAGNGNAGMGFSLPYSSISLDLSWGVPSYWLGGLDFCDNESAAGRLYLDGMELVPSLHDPLARGVCSLRTRPDTFGLIVPVWDPSNDCGGGDHDVAAAEPVGFAVVRPDGDIWWYGDHERCSDIGRVRTENAFGTHTSRWLLRHVSDRDGNLVTYWPERVPEDGAAATLLGSTPYGGDSDLRACDGCLRGISWADRLARSGDYAFDPVPITDGGVIVDWQAGSGHAYGSNNHSVTGRFSEFLNDPASFFPQPRNHYYFAQIDWEDRPDARISYMTGQGKRSSRRIKQITIGADGELHHLPHGNVSFDTANANYIRSYRLDYDMGPTGRSRLRRVWPVAGQYNPSGAYASVAPRAQLDWDSPSFGDDIDNPWELVWSDSSWLHSQGAPPELAVDMPIDAAEDEHVVPWLGANWQEGGFPTIILADMNGDALPDLVQHDPELPAYPVYLDELMTRVSPHGDWLPNPDWNGHSDVDMSSPNFWVRYNNGERFLPIEQGPLDPFALQEVADYIPGVDCDDDGLPDSQETCASIMRANLAEALGDPSAYFEDMPDWDCIPEGEGEDIILESAEECWDTWFLASDGPDLDNLVTAGSVCEVYWTGGPTMLGLLGISSTGITPPLASWCEHRSCAPYCEASSNANDGPFGIAHAGLLPTDTEPGTQGLELEDILALDTTKQPVDAEGRSGGDLVLWRKYAVTRGTTGTVMGNVSQLADFFTGPFALDPVLGALESQTRVRWVDGYARPSFQTRLYSEDVEILRGTGITTPLDMGDDAPESVVALAGHSPVLEGLIHDTIDLNGDGTLDRVLGGGAVLQSNVHGGQGRAVFNPDESAPKDLVVSTQHMPWFVSFGDPETGEFGDIQAWPMPLGDPLLGDDQPGQPHLAAGDPLDARMWQDHHFNLLGVWESTNSHARAPVSSGASASVFGERGPSLGTSASFGPISMSMGMSADGPSAGVGIGPVSISTTGIGLGPISMPFSGGVSVSPWTFVLAFVQMALQDFDIPYSFGITQGPDGLSWSVPGLGSDCILGCGFGQTRWQRQGLFDMNGDGLPDYVIADNPNWQTRNEGSLHDWAVVFNEGDGWADEAVEWDGAHTDYVSAMFTDLYRPEPMSPLNAEPFARLGNQVAGLQDMNGDRLPDFVFTGISSQNGECLAAPPRAIINTGPGEEPLSPWGLVAGNDLCVQLNNGHGFEAPRTWFPDGVPTEVFSPEVGHEGAGAMPALSTSRTYLEHSETYNDGYSTGIGGVQDWNGDGIIDYYRMVPVGPGNPLFSGKKEDRELVVYLGDGRGFRTGPVTTTQRLGRVTPSLDNTALNQSYPPGPPELYFELPQVNLSVTRKFRRPGGPVVQSRIVDLDGDGRLDFAQSNETRNGTPSIRVFALQDDVPDMLTGIWEPKGAHRELAYGPARDFLDLPGLSGPALLGAQLHGDLVDDAFPATSQVLTFEVTRDGLADSSSPSQFVVYRYGEPAFVAADPSLSRGTGLMHPAWRGRSLGWGQIQSSNMRQARLNEFDVEPMAAGLARRSVVTNMDGDLWSETTTGWSSMRFRPNYEDDNRADSWFPVHNWHSAPDRVDRATFEPSQAGAALRTASWTEYDIRNGRPVCVFEELDGDLWADSVAWTAHAGALLDDGKLDAVRADGVALLYPGGVNAGVQDHCGGLDEPLRPGTPAFGFTHSPVRSGFYRTYPSGRVSARVLMDETGASPERRVAFDYYPSGEPFKLVDDGGISRTSLLDPVVGIYPVEEHAPATYGPQGPVAHVTRSSACGLAGPQSGCTPAAHGAASWTQNRAGLETFSTYDGMGRITAIEDSLARLGPGAITYSYERAKRQAPVEAVPGGDELGNLPAVVHSSTPFDPVGTESRRVQSVEFLDGYGRSVLLAEDWIDETGTAGQKLIGWTRRNALGEPTESLLPCFAAGQPLGSQGDFTAVQGDQDSLGLCGVPAGKTKTQYDSGGRVAEVVQPDGSLLLLQHSIDTGAGGAVVATDLVQDGGLLSRTEVLTSPWTVRTRRFGAVTWTHPDATDLPGQPIQTGGWGNQAGDIDVSSWVDTIESFDALGRRVETTRSGVPAGEETRWSYNGFGGVVGYSDPDQGRWEFAYDSRGLMVRRELRHAWLNSPVVASEFDHDAQGRVVEERHFEHAAFGGLPADETWFWTYDVDGGRHGPEMGAAAEVEGGHVGKPTSVERMVPDLCGNGPGIDTVYGWRYDRRGRTTEESRTLLPCDWEGDALAEAPTLVAQHRYGNTGEAVWTRTPLDGEEIQTELDGVGRPTAVWSPNEERVYVAGASYELFGRPFDITFGNGVAQQFAYETGSESAQALVHSSVSRVSDGALYFERDYTWDAAGNLRQWTDADTSPWGGARGQEMGCTYDGLGQIQGCRGQTGLGVDGNPQVGFYQYGYDALGNVVFEDVDVGASQRFATQWTRGNGGLVSSSGADAPLNGPVARVLEAKPGKTLPSMSLFYDDRGHIVGQRYHDEAAVSSPIGGGEASDGGIVDSSGSLFAHQAERTFAWTTEGRLKEVGVDDGRGAQTTAQFWYGPRGDRVAQRQTPDGGPFQWVEQRSFAGLVDLVEREGESPRLTKHVHLGSRRVAQVDGEVNLSAVRPPDEVPEGSVLVDAEVRWFGGDHLGSASVITGAEGELLRGVRYEPYARILDEWGQEAEQQDFEAGAVRDLFNGKPRDRDAYGLGGTPFALEGYDYGARIYLPELARWASADSITPDSVWEANPFAYVRNNPLKYVDPTGHWTLKGLAKEYGRPVARMVVENTPVVGDVYTVVTGVVGRDLITGEKMSKSERALAVATGTIGLATGGAGSKAIRAMKQLDGLADVAQSMRAVEGIADAADAASSAKQAANVAEVAADARKGMRSVSSAGDGAAGASRVGGRGTNRVPDTLRTRPDGEQQALIDMAKSDSKRVARGQGPVSGDDADTYISLANDLGVPVRAKAGDLGGVHGYGPVPPGPDASHVHVNGVHVPVPAGYSPPPGSTVIE